jgi:hypothetical protein
MPILGITASSISGNLVTNSYESIATVTVGSGGQASVSFTSIPATYTHLQIRGIGRMTGAFSFEEYQITFNSDTGANYSTHYVQGSGTAASASAQVSQVACRSGSWIAGTSVTGSVFGTTVFDIIDYANTNKYKTMRMFGGMDANGSGYVGLASGLWMNTNAITTVTLDVPSDFAEYSQFALYGIKGA